MISVDRAWNVLVGKQAVPNVDGNTAAESRCSHAQIASVRVEDRGATSVVCSLCGMVLRVLLDEAVERGETEALNSLPPGDGAALRKLRRLTELVESGKLKKPEGRKPAEWREPSRRRAKPAFDEDV